MGYIAEKKRVKLVFKPALALEEELYRNIYGDESRFVQVIINFLSNSLKFSEANSKIVVFLKTIEHQNLKLTENIMKGKFL